MRFLCPVIAERPSYFSTRVWRKRLSMAALRYIGSELDLFAQAGNWKSYYGNLLRPYLGRTVLEVGAGIGSTSAALCDGTAHRWVCLEPDQDLADRIQRQIALGTLPRCCEVQVGTIAEVPRSETFETILYVDVLEHIRDDAEEVQQALQHLDMGGCLVIVAPAHPFLFTEFDKAIGHFRRYTKPRLRTLMPDTVRLEILRYLDSAGLMLSLSNRFLKRGMPQQWQIRFWDRVIVPLSRRLDPLLGYRVGKSILGIWRKAPNRSA
jgi:SAM-dependent methyltransferase